MEKFRSNKNRLRTKILAGSTAVLFLIESGFSPSEIISKVSEFSRRQVERAIQDSFTFGNYETDYSYDPPGLQLPTETTIEESSQSITEKREPTASLAELENRTYRHLLEFLESPPSSISFESETDTCIPGNVVPKTTEWPQKAHVKPTEQERPFALQFYKSEELPFRPVSFHQLNDRQFVCGILTLGNIEFPKYLVLADTSRIVEEYEEFISCPEFMMVQENETTAEAAERLLNLSIQACEDLVEGADVNPASES